MFKLLHLRYYLLFKCDNNSRISKYVNSNILSLNYVSKQFLNTDNFDNNFETKPHKPESELKSYNNSHSLDINDLSFHVTVTEMKRFLSYNKLKCSDGHTCLAIKCPFCNSQSKMTVESKKSPLFINKTLCSYICYSCEHTGNWTTFVELVASNNKKTKANLNLPQTDKSLFPDNVTKQELSDIFESGVKLSKLTEQQKENIFAKYMIRGLMQSSLDYFDARVSIDSTKLLFPLKNLNNEVIAIKSIDLNNDNTYNETIIPSNFILDVFGLYQAIKSNEKKELVITQTPFDAIAVTQQTGIPSISLPTRGITTLRPEILPFLEKFNKITLWFGSSSQDFNCAKSISRKLNEKRCQIIYDCDKNKKHETPLMALQNSNNLINCIESAQPISHSAIITFHSLRHAILSEMKDPLCSGVLWHRFPELNKHLKGHRNGELTVFTGPTGSGKTTFMSEYSLDLCMQGVRTLWGSFEVKNVRLAKMMLTQFAEKSVSNYISEFDIWADKFEHLPLYFLKFHGQESVANVLSAMSHAVYVHDIRHIIIDNIQFMLGCDPKKFNFDRYWQQDLVLDSFRKFATREDCHVSLVIHPRKEADMNELNNNSIFGGAKASQEADNILILQNKYFAPFKCAKFVEITKNRWDGDLGKVPLYFDKESLSYSPKSRRANNIMLTHTDNSNIDNTVSICSKANNSALEFARIKCKSEEEFDDLRLQ